MRTGPARTETAGAVGVVVRIPGALRDVAGGSGEVRGAGGTVGAVLDDVVARHPGLRRHLRDEQGALREHVNVYLNDDDIRWLQGERTPVAPGDALTVVPSIAGG